MSRIRSRLYGGLVQVLIVTLLVGPWVGPAPVAAAAQVSLPAQPASGLALSITQGTEFPIPATL